MTWLTNDHVRNEQLNKNFAQKEPDNQAALFIFQGSVIMLFHQTWSRFCYRKCAKLLTQFILKYYGEVKDSKMRYKAQTIHIHGIPILSYFHTS